MTEQPADRRPADPAPDLTSPAARAALADIYQTLLARATNTAGKQATTNS